MEKTKRKRGISLSHHYTPKPSSDLEESRVNEIMRPSATATPTPKQPRFSSAPKPKIIFSYVKESRSSTPYLASAHSNSAFSQSSNQQQKIATAPVFTPIAFPKEFEVPTQPKGIVGRRLFSARRECEDVSEVSTQTQRKNYFINSQFGIIQGQQSIHNAFTKEEYERVVQNRKKHLGISNKVVTFKQDFSQSNLQNRPSQQPFSKIELKEDIPEKDTGKNCPRRTNQDLQSLQDMQKRLREIINICDNRLV